MNVLFADSDFYQLERQKGLLYVTFPIFYEGCPPSGTEIKFILDTGSYLTVISRGTALRYGLDKLPKQPTTLFGFGGGVDVDFVRIPKLKVLREHHGVPVLIPHEMYRMHPNTGEKRPMPEVLGLNVLEYYNYYIDTENDRLYLRENMKPRFYDPRLASEEEKSS